MTDQKSLAEILDCTVDIPAQSDFEICDKTTIASDESLYHFSINSCLETNSSFRRKKSTIQFNDEIAETKETNIQNLRDLHPSETLVNLCTVEHFIRILPVASFRSGSFRYQPSKIMTMTFFLVLLIAQQVHAKQLPKWTKASSRLKHEDMTYQRPFLYGKNNDLHELKDVPEDAITRIEKDESYELEMATRDYIHPRENKVGVHILRKRFLKN